MSIFESDTIDSIISKIMLYLNEILVILGLILLLILLVRISLWLLHCNLCNKSADHSDPESITVESSNNGVKSKSSINIKDENNKNKKKCEKTKRKQKVNEEETSASSPPPPVPKPDFLKDDDHSNEQDLNHKNDLPLEPGQPKFRIISESQLPEHGDGQDPQHSFGDENDQQADIQKSVIQSEEISPDSSETANNSETVIDPIVSGVSTKLIINDDKDDGKITEQQQQEPHTYAQIIRRQNISENDKSSNQQPTNDDGKETKEENVVVTIDENTSGTVVANAGQQSDSNIEMPVSEYAVVDIEMIKPLEQKQQQQAEKIETVEMNSNSPEKEPSEPTEVDEPLTASIQSKRLESLPDVESEPQIVKRVPAHRCICPYCSSNNNRTSSTTSQRSSMIDSEEREVLKRLDETLEEMERLNESLAPLSRQQNNEEDYTDELEAELLKIAQEIHERKQNQQRKQELIIENKDDNQQPQQQQERTNNVNESEKSNNDYLLQSSDNNNVRILEPKQLDAYSTLIRNRIRVYEPEHTYHPRIVPNWISMKLRQKLNLSQMTSSPQLSSLSLDKLNRPQLPPKPMIIETILKEQSSLSMSDNVQTKQKPEHNRIIDRRRAFADNDDDDNDNDNDDDQEPQCAIYAKVIDQIKQRGNLNYHNHNNHYTNNHDHQNHQPLLVQQEQ
ncbi:hypothetical protein DERF_005881 [Dermatophagoides farinae]|uniref:Uncharacterized protein n=1 Tax=Dermatophagoides farinae TaxID=6954 RepID=A0A922L731_DERFA|nr:hypothetical protein DERF_005881 [Dermatophagoides farinae]